MSKSEVLQNYPAFLERYSIPPHLYTAALKSYTHNKKILKILLINRLYQLFHEIFQNKIQINETNYSMEHYTVDSKIIQLLIQDIIKTGEYSLEGIANYARIPFDIIFDAACGSNNRLSITPWMRIADLYTQVKPEMAQLLFNRLLEMKDKHHLSLSMLLNE